MARLVAVKEHSVVAVARMGVVGHRDVTKACRCGRTEYLGITVGL